MATKLQHLKRMHSFVITEHIRVLRSIADEAFTSKETVKGGKGWIAFNPFGTDEHADPTGEKRKKLLELWPFVSSIAKVELEGDSLLVYTAIV